MGEVRIAIRAMEKARREEARVPKQDKILKHLPVGFREEAEAMSPDQLARKIIEAEDILRENAAVRDQDQELAEAKSRVASLKEPYSDVEKAQRAVIALCLKLREEHGRPVVVALEEQGES